VALHLLDLIGDISSNGLSKLFLTIAPPSPRPSATGARWRYLGGIVPFGFRCGESGAGRGRSEWREKTEDWQVTGRGRPIPLIWGQHVH
jgi:hypothetical protein